MGTIYSSAVDLYQPEHQNRKPRDRIKNSCKDHRTIIISILVLVSILIGGVIILPFVWPYIMSPNRPIPISVSDGVFADNEKPLSELIFFQRSTIPTTICPSLEKIGPCFVSNISKAEIGSGSWKFENKDKKLHHFFRLEGNNITILKNFEGKLDFQVSMYKRETEQSGFVFLLNNVPYATCVFRQLHEKLSKRTRYCEWDIEETHRLRFNGLDDFFWTTFTYSHGTAKLYQGDVLTIKFIGTTAFLKGNPTLSFNGQIFF
jgi:hypothetical protein